MTDIVSAAEQIIDEEDTKSDPAVVAWVAEGTGYDLGVAAGRRLGPDLDRPDYELIITINKQQRRELLNANQRLHFREKADRTDYWRGRIMTEMHNAITQGEVPKLQRAWIFAITTWPDSIRRDAGNWYPTQKACVDGMVDSGLLPDDSDRHLIGPDMRSATEKGPMQIRFAIYDLGAAL